MEAGGLDSVVALAASEEVVPVAGVLVSVSVFCRTSAFSRVDLVEVLVNGVVLWTEDVLALLGIGIGNNQSHTFFPALTVAASDRVEVRLTKPNVVSAWSGRALAQVV